MINTKTSYLRPPQQIIFLHNECFYLNYLLQPPIDKSNKKYFCLRWFPSQNDQKRTDNKLPHILNIEFNFLHILLNQSTGMIKLLGQRGLSLVLKTPRFAFSGGHHPKPYDWRDDHALNPYYEQDPRALGIPNPYEYAQPFEAPPPKYQSSFPSNYNPKDLTLNFIGCGPSATIAEANLLEPHSQNLWEDIAHEWDYESEDLDFQPESFHSQHFRKKGQLWMWVFFALTPYIFVISEVAYQQMVDGDGLKYQRPPPLNYPDEQDTPDTETYENWKTPEFTYLYDAGILKDPFFEIIDGKKVYNKWAGVNQPSVAIK